MVESALEIFRILLNVSIKSVLTSSGAVEAIALPLTVDYEPNRWTAIELLESICSEEVHMGPKLVLEAINTLSSETGEEFRFIALLQSLESEDTPSRTKVVCLSLINQLIDSIPGLQERFEMRTEFMRMGFQGILAQLKADKNSAILLQIERELFETETKNDYEDGFFLMGNNFINLPDYKDEKESKKIDDLIGILRQFLMNDRMKLLQRLQFLEISLDQFCFSWFSNYFAST
jgi:hypothetical protein